MQRERGIRCTDWAMQIYNMSPRYVLNQQHCLPLAGIDDNITKKKYAYVKLELTEFYEYRMFNDSWVYVFLTGKFVLHSMLFRNGTD